MRLLLGSPSLGAAFAAFDAAVRKLGSGFQSGFAPTFVLVAMGH